MKKLYKNLALVVTFAVSLTAGLLIHRLFFKPNVWLSTSSSNKTYSVELTGDKGRGGIIFYSTVRFNVLKNGQTVVKDALAHYGDFMDVSFELAYPEHAWVSENTIRFWRNPHLPEDKDKFDTLLISNDTDKVIRYLKIGSGDMFLVFDMQPDSILKLSPSHQPGQSWVDCEGEFGDGQPIRCNGVNFSPPKSNETLRYCVSVGEQGVRIESPQTEGYDANGAWDKPNIGRALKCNQ
jgi:hypothetical protein